MMKILYIVNSLPPAGGAEKVAWDIANQASNYYEVHILTFHNKNKEDVPQNIKIHYLKNTDNNLRYYLFKGRKIVLDLIKEITPDVIHAHAPTVLAHIARNVKGPKKIMTYHHSYLSMYKWPIFRKLKFQYFQYASARSYDLLTTVSDHMTKYFSKIFNRKVINIANGYCEDIFSYSNIERKPKSVLYVGQLTEAKGVDVILDIANDLKGFTFTLIGSGKLKDSRDLDNVRFIGQKKTSELSSYYNLHEFSLFPSKYENYPLVGLEAMACGSIVIASNKGFPAYIENEKDGFIVPDSKSSEIEIILEKDHDMDLLRTNALKKVEKYKWGTIINKYRSLYESHFSN